MSDRAGDVREEAAWDWMRADDAPQAFMEDPSLLKTVHDELLRRGAVNVAYASIVQRAVQELRDLSEDLQDGPWGTSADPQVGIENVIATLSALAAADNAEEKGKRP